MTTVLRARGRCLEAFSAAVHDVQLERRGCRIYHFFDSDFLGRLIFGFRDPLNHALIRDSRVHDINNLSSQRLLMGCADRAGHRRATADARRCCRTCTRCAVRSKARVPTRPATASSSRRTSWGSRRRSTSSQRARRARPRRRTARPLPRSRAQIFYGTELLSGRWQTRLGRVLELGIREPGPFTTIPRSVGSPAFEVLAQHVVHTGRESRGNGGVSGLRDAMALATLADAVAGDDGAEAERVEARFYTETPRIHRAWRESPDMRALLSYRIRDGAVGHDDYGQRGVLRTVDYYLIRALIPELGYDNDADAGDAGHTIFTIADHLSDAAKELDRGGLGAMTWPTCASARARRRVHGRGHRPLLLRHGLAAADGEHPARPAQDARQQLEEVFRGERRRADDLEQSFQRHVKSLSTRTRDVGEFTETYVHLPEALGRWEGPCDPSTVTTASTSGSRAGGSRRPTRTSRAPPPHRCLCRLAAGASGAGGADLDRRGRPGDRDRAEPARHPRAVARARAPTRQRGVARLPVAARGLSLGRQVRRRAADRHRDAMPGASGPDARSRRSESGRVRGGGGKPRRRAGIRSRRKAARRADDARPQLVARARTRSSRGSEEGRPALPRRARDRSITQGYVMFHAWLAFNAR